MSETNKTAPAYTILSDGCVVINKNFTSIYLDDAEFDSIVAEVTAFRAKQREDRIAKLKAEAEALDLVLIARREWITQPKPSYQAGDFYEIKTESTQSPFGEDKED